MEDYLTCNVCVELFDNKEHLPLILSCGHSLCKCCISSIRQAQGFIMCPIDRSPESKPIESLITNLALLQLVDVSRYTDHPRCPLHPSKKLRYYCHAPCARAFCSKCTLSHNTHSCFDPEDAKSFEALLIYIENELVNLNTEAGYSQTVITDYSSQLTQLGDRQQLLVHEVSVKFRELHAALNEKERQTLEQIEKTTLDIKEAIEVSLKQANQHIEATSSALREVLSLRDSLKQSMPQERLAYTVKLHKLLSTRISTFHVAHDYLKKLSTKLKTPSKKLSYSEEKPKGILKHLMNVENDYDTYSIGVKRARMQETE